MIYADIATPALPLMLMLQGFLIAKARYADSADERDKIRYCATAAHTFATIFYAEAMTLCYSSAVIHDYFSRAMLALRLRDIQCRWSRYAEAA